VLSIIIPAYNEGASIANVVKEVREVMEGSGVAYEIIVVDDGSTDDTAERAEGEGIRLIRHPVNSGYGRALKSGIAEARYPWCAITDADSSYPIERLPELLSYTDRFDMVVGARTGKHYWGSPANHVARWMLLRLVGFVVGMRVPDVNSGMRIFRKDLALAHSHRISSGFSFTTTLTLALLLDERFVCWVPIEYHPRVGDTKVRYRRDTLRMVQILVQAVLYYNPLKIFLAVCLGTALCGLALGAVIALFDPISGILFAGIGLLVASLIGAVGFVAETLRLNQTGGSPPKSEV
jgi:glycosyltransferase involved in cell wall biosynthesis